MLRGWCIDFVIFGSGINVFLVDFDASPGGDPPSLRLQLDGYSQLTTIPKGFEIFEIIQVCMHDETYYTKLTEKKDENDIDWYEEPFEAKVGRLQAEQPLDVQFLTFFRPQTQQRAIEKSGENTYNVLSTLTKWMSAKELKKEMEEKKDKNDSRRKKSFEMKVDLEMGQKFNDKLISKIKYRKCFHSFGIVVCKHYLIILGGIINDDFEQNVQETDEVVYFDFLTFEWHEARTVESMFTILSFILTVLFLFYFVSCSVFDCTKRLPSRASVISAVATNQESRIHVFHRTFHVIYDLKIHILGDFKKN